MPSGGKVATMSDSHAPGESSSHPPAGGDHHEPTDHDGDHGHGESQLGPVDVPAWAAGLLGVGIAIVIALCLAIATSGVG